MSEEQSDLQQGVNKESAIQVLRAHLIKEGTGEEIQTIPLFIGPIGERHRVIYQTAVVLMAVRDAVKEENKGAMLPEDRNSNALRVTLEGLVEEHFPGSNMEDLEPMLINYIRFMHGTVDRLLARDANLGILERAGLGNTTAAPLAGNGRMGLISPVIPQNNDKLGVRDRMRRKSRLAAGDPDSFNLVLLNSMIYLRVKIPTPTELVRLVNDIQTKLRNYGERYNVTSLQLERAGIAQILVDFILDRLTYHSVKDVSDHYELKRYIKANDINPMVMALLTITAPKGLEYRTYCLAGKCNYSKVNIIDPATMLLDIEEDMPAEHRQLLFRIINERHKLSREELAKIVPTYVDEKGQPIETSILIGEGQHLEMGIPSLEDYFGTFNSMVERINPTLTDLAINFPNLNDFKEKRNEYLASIRGSEYLQWYKSLRFDAAPGTEGDAEVITRDENPEEFEAGLLDIFGDNEETYVEALSKVIYSIPRMTYSYVGISNDVCPNCKETHPGLDQTSVPGFTPIDPIMNFFALARMTIGTRTSLAYSIEENLS